MNIFKQLKQDINIALSKIDNLNLDNVLDKIHLEVPKNHLHGDLSTNIAIIAAKHNKCNPRDIADIIVLNLKDISYIDKIDIAGAGFINFTIKNQKWLDGINDILFRYTEFTKIDIDNNKKINIEYVSANPTGPLHIGHARGAVYGDVLARMLKICGYNVTKEYYINDSGAQISTLVDTVMLRYKESITKEKIVIPEGLYPGEYLIPIGAALAQEYGDKLLQMQLSEARKIIRVFAVNSMLALIKKDLDNLGVQYDVFTSEQSLYDNGIVEETILKLQNDGLIYEGILEPPKGKIDNDWQQKTQLLFRSSKFGDDQDRVVKKADGTYTYFASDIAYAKNKIDRNFNHLVYVLGADHSGYTMRINAIIEAIGNKKVISDVKICQLVNFMEDGISIKMSKRKGTFTTVADVINAVGSSIIRFIMLTRKNDMTIDFDLTKVKQHSKDNPVFYVQYAHVRTHSIISSAKENFNQAYNKFILHDVDLSLLSSKEEIEIIKMLVFWPKIIESAVEHFEPHRIVYYLIKLASSIHSMWNLGKENNDYRFIVFDDINITAARLTLVQAIQIIIANGLEILGVEPLDKM